jgi:hypothetical protein
MNFMLPLILTFSPTEKELTLVSNHGSERRTASPIFSLGEKN